MQRTGTSSGAQTFAKASCVFVIALMLASLVYVAGIAISQYGSIGV